MRRERADGGGRGLLWIAVLVIIAAALFLWLRREDAEQPLPPVMLPAEEEQIPVITHPLPELPREGPEEGDAGVVLPEHLPAELPALDASDAVLERVVAHLVANPRLFELLAAEHLVRRIVVTVENLPRPGLPLNLLPARLPEGRFLVTREGEESIAIDPRNHARYGQHVALFDGLDTDELVAAYVHLYPLFEEAYRDLGFPQAHFNDRLVAVIDHLLETPDVGDAPALAQPSVVYIYADPDLEALSAGQKLLVRMGTDHAAVVKGKLRDIRAALVR